MACARVCSHALIVLLLVVSGDLTADGAIRYSKVRVREKERETLQERKRERLCKRERERDFQ